ncbi:putative MFS-type transporter C09D4.1 [Dermacentor variabilis]|uniref:putative MFS-type transporter C09D4.1 n=1 Tax=Dermacentor variabilis TaxID=34621 RepID=UPI003F5B8CD6
MSIPCAWILDIYGLRVAVLCGACGSAIGSCIKLFSIGPDLFATVLIGQAFPALATAFTSAVPARLASAWFKYEEISTASSAGMLGVQLGTALGFFVPSQVLDKNDIQGSLRTLCIGVATASCLTFLVAIACFEEKPVHPPSFSEMLNRYADIRVSFGEGMHVLIKDRNFILLLLSYGINTGSFYSMSTLLNPVITSYFPGEESFAGILGLSMIISGFLGSWVGGVVVDKTAMFKEVTLAAYIFSTMAMLLHTIVLLMHSYSLTIIVCVFLGFFMTGYMPLAVQLGAEITYPLNEALPASLLSMSAQGTSLILTPICSFVIAKFGHVASNVAITGMLVIGCLMMAVLRAELKRQKAFMRVQRKRSSTIPRYESSRAPSSVSEELDAETERSKDTASSV